MINNLSYLAINMALFSGSTPSFLSRSVRSTPQLGAEPGNEATGNTQL